MAEPITTEVWLAVGGETLRLSWGSSFEPSPAFSALVESLRSTPAPPRGYVHLAHGKLGWSAKGRWDGQALYLADAPDARAALDWVLAHFAPRPADATRPHATQATAAPATVRQFRAAALPLRLLSSGLTQAEEGDLDAVFGSGDAEPVDSSHLAPAIVSSVLAVSRRGSAYTVVAHPEPGIVEHAEGAQWPRALELLDTALQTTLRCAPRDLFYFLGTLLARGDQGVWLSGTKGAGKSTVAAALVERHGFGVVSDDYVVLSPSAQAFVPIGRALRCRRSERQEVLDGGRARVVDGTVGFWRTDLPRAAPPALAQTWLVACRFTPHLSETSRSPLTPVELGAELERRWLRRAGIDPRPFIGELTPRLRAFRLLQPRSADAADAIAAELVGVSGSSG